MNIPFLPSETPTEQEIYVCQMDNLRFYCFIVFNRTKWSREQIVENWGSHVSLYRDGKPFQRIAINQPEVFENVTEYCLARAQEISNEWLNMYQPAYVVSI